MKAAPELKRAFKFALVLVAFASTAACCGPRQAAMDSPECAFADESFSMFLAVASATTEYYARHRVWPSTTPQLRAEILHSIATSAPIAANPTAKDVDRLFSRFSRIQLVPRDRDLILDVRYRAEGKTCTHRILIHPGKNSDEMLEGAVEAK